MIHRFTLSWGTIWRDVHTHRKMIQQGVRLFNQKKFFGSLLPGAVLLIGLLPFVPKNTSFGTELIATLVILGFVAGRAVYSGAIYYENLLTQGPVEIFKKEIRNPNYFPKSVILSFIETSNSVHSRIEASQDSKDDELESLYMLIRSQIHNDLRSQSQTFYTNYVFHRSMRFVLAVLGLVYILYGFGTYIDIFRGIVRYESYIRSLGLPPLVLILVPITVLLLTRSLIGEEVHRQQRKYIQYLMADFITLHETEQATSEQATSDDDRDRSPPSGPAR